jgi:predicted ArsR family transcriptional regulator
MNTTSESSDKTVLDHLRRVGEATVGDLAVDMGVTATAVRQRLQRLMAEGVIERRTERKSRGRPNHRYLLTEKGERISGSNFADLASVLWEEIKAVEDPAVRRGLVKRIADRFAGLYQDHVSGETLRERMTSLAGLMDAREIPFEVDSTGDLPVLSALACPYPELAKLDRSVCTMEKLMLSEVLGESVKLSECRLDGAPCCTFTPSAAYVSTPTDTP